MPGTEDEAVAIEPARFLGIVAKGMSEEDGTDVGAAEREAEVAGGAGVNGIHGEAAGFRCSSRESGQIKVHNFVLLKTGRETAKRPEASQVRTKKKPRAVA